MVFHVPEVLAVARRHRETGTLPDVGDLWELSGHDADLFVHACVEAGHVRPLGSKVPYEDCPLCGWRP